MNDDKLLKRQSNIELLRIVSMFLVLMVHFNFQALGNPWTEGASKTILYSRVFLESLAICCVNVFILISGYFGIKPSVKGLFSFLYQCFFYAIIIYFAHGIITHNFSINTVGFRSALNFNWFIVSYLGLYCISPILNSFVENADRSLQKKVIVGFIVFQTIFGFVTAWCKDFDMGYSILSFMGLYLIARYIYVWKPDFLKVSRFQCLLIYLIMSVMLSILWILFKSRSSEFAMLCYNNPLVIIEAIALFLLFTKINIRSKVVNVIAKSAFSVFLVHTNVFIGQNVLYPYLKSFYINNIGEQWGGVIILVVFFVIAVGVYICSILLDQIRLMTFNPFIRVVTKIERSINEPRSK